MHSQPGILFISTLLALTMLAGACYTRRSEPLRGPLEQRSAAINNGEIKFYAYCDKCHPGGEAGLGPALNIPTPRFAKAFQIRHGLGVMPAFKKKELSKKDLWDITTYLKALRKNGLAEKSG